MRAFAQPNAQLAMRGGAPRHIAVSLLSLVFLQFLQLTKPRALPLVPNEADSNEALGARSIQRAVLESVTLPLHPIQQIALRGIGRMSMPVRGQVGLQGGKLFIPLCSTQVLLNS